MFSTPVGDFLGVNDMSFREQHPALFEGFFNKYVNAALWASTDTDSGRSLNNDFSVDDINSECLESMKVECSNFIEQNIDLLGDDIVIAGHDFWLTRNHRGAIGFSYGGWGKSTGKTLTERSHAFGSCDLYVGNDGCLYVA